MLRAADFLKNLYFIKLRFYVIQVNIQGSTRVRPSLDFRMIFAFNLMAYLDFFKPAGDHSMPFGRKKEEMKGSIGFLSLLNPDKKSDRTLIKLL